MTEDHEKQSGPARRGLDLDALNKWLILLTNVGVLAGVFLLAVEIRQNHEIMTLWGYEEFVDLVEAP